MLNETELAQLRATHLVETDWLVEHLSDPNLRIVDMRGYVLLQTTDEGQQESVYIGARDKYEQGHIPGAIYLDWTQDIVDTEDPVAVQVAKAEKLAKIFGEAGIGDEHQVIVYDSHPQSQFATRLWWVFRYIGHDNLRILNGGLKKWQAEDRPLDALTPNYPPATFTAKVQPEWRMTAEELLQKLGNKDFKLIDARDTGQYTGAVRRSGRAGRIPGALSLPREDLLDPQNGTFRPAADIAQILSERTNTEPGEPVTAYCNGGVASTVVLFSLSMAGYSKLTNYDGSWNEWGDRKDLPVEN